MTTAVKNWFELELKTGCWIDKVGNFVGCKVVVVESDDRVREAEVDGFVDAEVVDDGEGDGSDIGEPLTAAMMVDSKMVK